MKGFLLLVIYFGLVFLFRPQEFWVKEPDEPVEMPDLIRKAQPLFIIIETGSLWSHANKIAKGKNSKKTWFEKGLL